MTTNNNTTPWRFFHDVSGVVMLVLTDGEKIMPVLAFYAPEALRAFARDAQLAYQTFVPPSVRQAMDTVEKYTNKIRPPDENPTTELPNV